MRSFPTNKELNSAFDDLSMGGQVTRFSFLNEVGGFRKGYLYGLLSTTGAGKSSLLRSIISDVSTENKVFVWLSEESISDYSIMTLKTKPDLNKGNFIFFSEKSISKEDRQRFKKDTSLAFKFFQDKIIASGAEYVFFDNLTTSCFYDQLQVDQQSAFVTDLNSLAEEFSIGIFYICHTEKSIKENNNSLIDGTCVRGSNQTFQMASFFFVMQRFTSNNDIYSFIKIEKHRIVPIKNKWFSLSYRDDHYKTDAPVNFSKVRDAFNLRDTLSIVRKKEVPMVVKKTQSWMDDDKDL